MNVVAAWRNRARALRGEFGQCQACRRYASVRRTRCARCGHTMTESKTVPLPQRMRAAGYSHRHTVVEVMDQSAAEAPFMLADGGDGQLFAFPLCESDARSGPLLVGEELELVLRRSEGELSPTEAIAYRRKLAATQSTRAKLKSQTKAEGRKP